MAYGVLIDMAASKEFYDAAHAEFSKYPAEAMVLKSRGRPRTGTKSSRCGSPGRTTSAGPASTWVP
jgi:hypothetical protein